MLCVPLANQISKTTMKRFFMIALFCAAVVVATAQNSSTWIHHGNQPLSQCFDILEMSDGNLAVKEAVFDEENNDIGYNIYKITPLGELLDSLFIEEHHINPLAPMLRDPYNTNSNIVTTFYSDGNGHKFYKALYFTNNLDVTDEIVAQLPDDCPLPYVFLIDNNNDIICIASTGNNNYQLLRIGLDGSVKQVSEIMDINSGMHYSEHPLFIFNTEPLQYGFVTCNNSIVIEIFDENFNQLSKTIIKKIDGATLDFLNYNVTGIEGGGFIITARGFISGRHPIMTIKFDKDLNVVAINNAFEYTTGYPRASLVNKNLVLTDNSVFVEWQLTEQEGNEKKTTLMLTCLDDNLNLRWERPTLEVSKSGFFGCYGMRALDNGGVALSGWFAVDNSAYYSTKDIYAIVFDNYLSTPENLETKSACVFPNPSHGIINIKAENIVHISVYNILGNKLFESAATGNSFEYDFSTLDAGIYFIKVKTTGKEFVERVVKK